MRKFKHIPTNAIYKEIKTNSLYNRYQGLGTTFAPQSIVEAEGSKDWEEIFDKPEYTILSFYSLTPASVNLGKPDPDYIWKKCSNKHNMWARFVDGKFVTVAFTFTDILANKNYAIHSVRRESDGEVFTIGDNTQFGKVISFDFIPTYEGEILKAICKNGPATSTISIDILEFKTKLFTTEDGVDIYEGDTYYIVGAAQWNINSIVAKNSIYRLIYTHPFFSTKEKAEEYIILNKPCLSLKEINDECAGYIIYPYRRIKEIVKQKILGTQTT